jgi:hypothetical protein
MSDNKYDLNQISQNQQNERMALMQHQENCMIISEALCNLVAHQMFTKCSLMDEWEKQPIEDHLKASLNQYNNFSKNMEELGEIISRLEKGDEIEADEVMSKLSEVAGIGGELGASIAICMDTAKVQVHKLLAQKDPKEVETQMELRAKASGGIIEDI